MAQEDQMEMRAMMSRWEETRARWALSPDEEAELLGGTGFAGPVGEAKSWHAGRLEQRMRLLVDLGNSLESLMRDETHVRRWLRRPMAGIGHRRPIAVMASSVEWIRNLRNAVQDFLP